MIIRRIDELGRVVIPRDMQRELGLGSGDPLELSVYNKTLVIKKVVEEVQSDKLLQWAEKMVAAGANSILTILPYNRTVEVIFYDNGREKAICLPRDTFNLTIGIAVCCAKHMNVALPPELRG